jgi:FSR family fosmidomycin resistance protein-like MFS transporter
VQSDPSPAGTDGHGHRQTVLGILLALSASHLINDTLQALLPAIYPMLKASFRLTFTQIGLITLSYQLTASLLQPFVGTYTDRKPKPFSLAAGMTLTLAGLVLLSLARSYGIILVSSVLIGMGSSIFHPEASRVAHMAAGVRHGFAQALFQVGGNLGTSFGPLLAAIIIVPNGQASILWFTLLALAGIALLLRVGRWYGLNVAHFHRRAAAQPSQTLPRRTVVLSLLVLMTLIFSKYFYLASLTNYYTFYLIHRFNLSIQGSQLLLFVFLASVAAGTILGGPLGDRFGRKYVIWVSILGVAPFSLALPHVGLASTVVMTVFIGVILASAFSAILVYAQEMIPGRVGMMAGLFFGLAFGIGGIASAALGRLADLTSIGFVFNVCGYLPLIGLITWFLPDIEGASRRARRLQREAVDPRWPDDEAEDH